MSGIDPAHFRQVLGHFPTGVTVVTAMGADEQPTGFAIGSFFSISLEPALVGFCAGKDSSTWPAIQAAGAFCVNVLADDQEAISRRFAAAGDDKFAGVAWVPGTRRVPRLGDAVAWIDCEVDDVHDAGDHEICVGRVVELQVARETGPLVFYRGGYGRFAV